MSSPRGKTPQSLKESNHRKTPQLDRSLPRSKELKTGLESPTSLDTIAWLFPSHHSAAAQQTISLNQTLVETPPSWVRRRLPASYTQSRSSATTALRIPLDERFPKCNGRITLGTDPATSDIVLPRVPGLSRRHCALTFDRLSRLVLRDSSRHGSAVWYDDQSCGDQVGFEWILSPGLEPGFPDAVRHLFLDLQSICFCVVVAVTPTSLSEADPRAALELESRVRRFMVSPYDRHVQGRLDTIVRLPAAESDSESEQDQDQYYMWNLARPWEPVVKLAASA